jgi:hypothetical protein
LALSFQPIGQGTKPRTAVAVQTKMICLDARTSAHRNFVIDLGALGITIKNAAYRDGGFDHPVAVVADVRCRRRSC